MAGKQKETKELQLAAKPAAYKERQQGGTMQLQDRRATTVAQEALQRKIQNSSLQPSRETAQLQAAIQHSLTIQRKANGGLPSQLRSGIESLSGMDMGGVKVNYNSPKPAQLQAHAYAQGNSIHLGPGQEKHLPHEAWHVVQQRQGRVKPTMQMAKININDDKGLEGEADRMGAKATKVGKAESSMQRKVAKTSSPIGAASTTSVQMKPAKKKRKK